MRRGRAAAHKIWGNKPTILVGDFLFSRAFQLMVATGSPPVLDMLANASAIISEGEVMQLRAPRNLATSEDDYMKVVTAKTAALFSAASGIGRRAGHGERPQVHGLARIRPQSRHRLSADRRRARLFRPPGGDGKTRRRRFPRKQDDAAGDPGAEARRRRRAPLLEEDHRGRHAGRRRPLARHRDSGTRRRARRNRGARARLCGGGAQRLWPRPEGEIKTALADIADFVVERAY